MGTVDSLAAGADADCGAVGDNTEEHAVLSDGAKFLNCAVVVSVPATIAVAAAAPL